MKGSRFYFKAAAATALVLLLGAGAALVAVKVFFPEPRARAWFVDTARRQLGRDVRLSRIDVGLRGLTLVGLEVSEKPDFTAGTFLKVADFRLRPSWRALLRRKLVVAAVSADGLKVRVVQGKDGHFNYETLASSAAAASPPSSSKPGETAPPELDVRRATVLNGAVDYRGADGAAWTLEGVSLDLSDFSQAEPFGLKASFRAVGRAGDRPVDAQVAFDGRVDLARGSREKLKVEVKKLVVEQDGLKLAASGSATGLDAPALSFDAALSAAGQELLTAAGTAKLGAAVAADLKWNTRALDTSLVAKYAPQAGVPELRLPAAEGALSGTYAGGAAEVKSFSASWAGGKVEGAASARGLGSAKPAVEGRAAFGLDVPEIEPGQYPFLKLPPQLALPAARLDGDVSFKGGDLKIASLTAKVKQGTVSATGSVKGATSAKPVPDVAVVLALDLPAFTVSDLPVAVPVVTSSFGVPAGRLQGTVLVSGEDVSLKKLSFKTKGADVAIDGTVARAFSGAPAPVVALTADLDLPALTGKDLPFPGVPPGLLMPASRWSASLDYSPRLLRVRSMRAISGHNDVEASGTLTDPSGRGAFDLLFKCRSFSLDELTRLTPKTRDLKLAGSGFFALSVTGTKDKPVFAGKLQFKDLGATVADLPLSGFTGTMSFDADRVDVPNLAGRVADGKLEMDLTVKDYAKSPAIELEASLDRFDLGRYLAAKSELVKERADAEAARAAKTGRSAAPAEKPTPIAVRGHLNVGTLIHPNATVSDVKVGWDLRGITPDMKSLSGDAKLHVGAGKLVRIEDMALQSKVVKILLFPILIVQKIRGVDLNDISLNQIVGDYAFKDGVMTLRQAGMDSNEAHVNATGTIDLPVEALDLIVTAEVGNLVPVETAVTGTFDAPKSKVKVAKLAGQLLLQGIKNISGQQ